MSRRIWKDLGYWMSLMHDELFGRTTDFLSGFGGGFVIEPNSIVEEDDGEDKSDMVEVTMSGWS